MSTEVDKRIVRMVFDNEKFEKGISTTISSLDNLNDKLKFKGTSKSIAELGDSVTALKGKMKFDDSAKSVNALQAAINAVSFNTLSAGIDAVKSKFSAMNVVAITAISEMTKKALHAGESITNALTITPVKSGFEEYETQLNAVQTILANTKSKGETIDTVNDALNELNTYADETIYNFTEMTRNIGTFTAAGVGLKDSVSAIKGIANLAAMVGSTSTQASTAMYQLSQAISSGRVSLQDWNSVVNAGMGGTALQGALLEAAKEQLSADEFAGVESLVNSVGFRQSMAKDSWITSDILISALQKFTDTSTELGRTATDAATKVKTITQLWDTIKEEVQSSWTQSWQYLIGDFEEAKELLTKVKDKIVEIIAPMGIARNAILEFWHDAGGRDVAIQAFAQTFTQIEKLVKPVVQAFKNVIPPMTGEKLVDLTNKFKALTDRLDISEGTMTSIRNIFEGLFSVLKLGGNIISSTASVLIRFLSNFTGLAGSALKMAGDLGLGLKNLINRIISSKAISKILNNIFTDKLAKNILRIANGIKAFGNIIANIANTIIKRLNVSGSAFIKLSKIIGKVIETLSGFVAGIADLIVWLDKWIEKNDAINKSIDFVIDVFNVFKDTIKNAGSELNSFIEQKTGLNVFKTLSKTISKITDSVNRFKMQITELFYSIQNAHSGEPKVLTVLRTSLLAIKILLNKVKSAINGFLGKFNAFNKAKTQITELFTSIQNAHPGEPKALIALRTSLLLISSLCKDVSKAILGIDWSGFGKGLLDTITNLKDKVKTKLQAVGQVITDIVDDIKDSLFSKDDNNKPTTIEEQIDAIKNGADGVKNFKIGDIIKAALKGIVDIISSSGNLIITVVKKVNEMVGNLQFSDILSAINTASLYNISDSLKNFLKSATGFTDNLSDIAKSFKDVGKSITSFIDELGNTLKAFQLKAKAEVLYTIAKSVAILAASIMLLSLVPDDEILVISGVVAGLVGELTGALIALTKIGDFKEGVSGAATTLLAMSTAILIISFAFKNLAKLSPEGLAKSVIAMTVVISEFTGALVIIAKNSKHVAGAAAMIKAMASAIKWLALVVVVLGQMKWEKLQNGLVGVGTLAAIILAFMALAAKIGPINVAPIYAVAVAINLVSLALLPAVLSILALSLIPNLLKGFLGFVGIIAAMSAAVGILGKLKINVAGVLAAAVAIDLISLALIPITASLAILSMLNQKKMWSSVAALAVGLAGLTVVLCALGAAGPMVLVGAAALLVASASLVVLAVGMAMMIPVITWFSKNAGTAMKGIGVLSLAIIAFGLACAIASPGVILLASGFLIFGAAIFLIGTGVAILALGLTSLAGALTLLSKIDMQALVDNITSFFVHLGERAGEIAASVVNMLTAFIKELMVALPELVDAILELLVALLTAINNHITEIAELAGSILIGIAAGAIMGLLDWITENADAYVSKLVAAISAWVDALATHLPELQKNMIQAFKKFYKLMIGNIKTEIIDPIKTWLKNKVKGIFDGLFGEDSIFDKVKDFGGKIISKIADGITGAFDKIKDIASKVSNTIMGVFGLSKSEKAAEKSAEKETSGNIFDNFIDSVTIAKDSLEKFIEFVKLNSDVQAYRDLGKTLSDGIIEGFKQNIVTSGLLKLKTPAEDLLNAASQAFKASEYNNIGKNIVDGIITGIRSKQSDLNQALSDLANASVTATNETLGIHSPSRVFAETGKYIILGLINGINSAGASLRNTMSDISDSTISTMDILFNKLDDTMTSDMFNPSITPVLNMSSLNSEMSSFNSAFSKQAVKLNGLNGDITANIADSMDGFVQNDNSDIVNELYALRGDVNYLNESLSNMQVIMDSGELVGSLSGKMNNTLGKRTLLTKRGGF